jgi:hypothetical protein
VKASRAYIAGLGTSGVLIASFLLLLMVGSAIVAFQGAPGQASNDGLDRLDVSDESRRSAMSGKVPLSGGHRASDASTPRGDRGRGNATAAARRAHIGAGPAAGAGGVEGERAAGGLTGGASGGGAAEGNSAAAGRGPSDGGNGGDARSRAPAARAPSQGDGVGGQGPASAVTGGLAGAVESTTDGLGETVGRVAPPLEAPVQQTGAALGGVVEQTGPVVDGTVGQVNGTVNDVTGAVGGVADRVRDTTGGLLGAP